MTKSYDINTMSVEPMKHNGTNGQEVTTLNDDMMKAATITYHNLTYTVQQGRCCKKTPKEILHGVNGILKPGLNAIMGPTGSGKTTLLDAIAGRKDPSGVGGTILVNGQPQPPNFKCMTGYVVQDDIVMGTLTVKENLMFSANLRLSRSISHNEKVRRVDNTIEELGLTHCADSKIGTPFIRGVSGGERKRCNIGMELIIGPPVLFLDEPTTGLDASTAGSVCQLLKDLSLKGRTIVFSIHQPRYSIYKLFDRLVLLSQGSTVYHGPSVEALEFFSSLGFECELHDNPPDFFLDVICGENKADRALLKAASELKNGKANGVNGVEGHTNQAVTVVEVADTQNIEDKMTARLAENYKSSKWNKDLMSEIDPIVENFESGTSHAPVQEVQYTTNFLVQLAYVSKRQLMNAARSPQITVLQTLVSVFLAIVVGLLFLNIYKHSSSAAVVQNVYGLFFFITMNQIFSNLSSLEVFITERVIFIHENSSGFYRVSAYFFAKVFCDMIPLRVIPVAIFSIIVYFMTGLTVDAGKFFFFLLDLLLVSMSAASVCFFVSVGTTLVGIANLQSAMIFVSMMIFGGIFLSIESIVVWLRWLKYFSIFRYSVNGLSVNEIHGIQIMDYTNASDPYILYGDAFLTKMGINHSSDWDLWQNEFALAMILSGFLALTYFRLRIMNKYK